MKQYLNVAVVLLLSVISLDAHVPANRSAEDDIETISKKIVEYMNKGEFENVRSYFSFSLKNTLTAEHIEKVWTNVVTQLGEFEKISSVKTEVVQSYNVVRVRCKFRNEGANVEVTFNEEKEVIGLYIKP